MIFKNRIVDILKERGLKQADLCRMTNISTSLMSNYATGKASPTLENAIVIADALRISLDELAGRPSRSPFDITAQEKKMIIKYRTLDDRGKGVITGNLDREYNYAVPSVGDAYDPPAQAV